MVLFIYIHMYVYRSIGMFCGICSFGTVEALFFSGKLLSQDMINKKQYVHYICHYCSGLLLGEGKGAHPSTGSPTFFMKPCSFSVFPSLHPHAPRFQHRYYNIFPNE